MSLWKKIFGGGDFEGRIKKAEMFAGDESWPEAISTIDRALAALPDDSDLGPRLRSYRDRYVISYKRELAGAIPQLREDEQHEQAEELISIALALCATERECEEFRQSIAVVPSTPPPPPEPTADAPVVADGRSENDIDVLADAFAEALEPEEKDAIFARPMAFRQGFVLWNEDRFAEAEEAIRIFLDEVPDDPYGLLYHGLSVAQTGTTADAISMIEKATQLDPSMVVASLALAHLKTGIGDLDGAADIVETLVPVLDEHPNRFGRRRRDEVHGSAVETALAAGRVGRALEFYDDFIENEKMEARIDLELRIAIARGDDDLAAGLWPEWLSGSHSTSPRPTIADFEEAGEFFHDREDHVRAYGCFHDSAIQLAEALHQSHDPAAEQVLHRLKRKMAEALVKLEKWGEVEAIAMELERLDPPPPEAAEIRAMLDD